MGAAWGDYDNDGWLDLAVSGYNAACCCSATPRPKSLDLGERRLMASEAVPNLPGYWAGVSWADIDNDGDLDLYVCGYVQYREDASATGRSSSQSGTTVPYTLNPASYEPERNLLFQNEGDGTFAEVALPFGLSNPEGRSLSALWHDFDQDGLARRLHRQRHLRQRPALSTDGRPSRTSASRPGWPTTAGRWVSPWATGTATATTISSSLTGSLRRTPSTTPAWPKPRPPGTRCSPSAISRRPWAWARSRFTPSDGELEFADFDADGWLDLVVANGSTLETPEPPKWLKTQPAMLLWSQSVESTSTIWPRPVTSWPRHGWAEAWPSPTTIWTGIRTS